MSSEEKKPNGRITNQDIYDLFNEVKKDLALVTQKLDTEIQKNEKLISDHELRIRSLEKLVWTSSWVSSAVSTIVTAVAVMFFTGKL